MRTSYRSKAKISAILLGAVYALVMISMAFAMPDHIFDVSWPDHARNHLAQSIFWFQGLGLLGLLGAVKFVKERSSFLWIFHLLIGLSIFGGYFAGILITGGGAPGSADDIFFGILWFIHIAGLVIGRTDHL